MGKFTLCYVVIYTFIAVVFLKIQNALPASGRVGLDFFEPYSVSITGTLEQAIIAAIMALVLYPFYDTLVGEKRGWVVIFAALWGVAFLGSLHPKPGTIEGMLYTEITFAEHFMVLAAGAVQVLLFAWLFLNWERRRSGASGSSDGSAAERTNPDQTNGKLSRGYVGRFTLLHVLVYIIVGALFYEISGYEEALATMDEFALWRPLENIVMPFIILFGQIIRGGILALFLYPFYHIYMKRQHGWVLLFGLLFGLKVLAAAISVPETIDLFMQGLQDMKVGLPEITAQTLLFAWLFYSWERRRIKKVCLGGNSSW